MGTTAEKLQAIIDSKEAIRQAIVDKGVSCDTTVPLDEYATKIGDISGGGGASVEISRLVTLSTFRKMVANATSTTTKDTYTIGTPIDIPILEAKGIGYTQYNVVDVPDGSYVGYWSLNTSNDNMCSEFEIFTDSTGRYLRITKITNNYHLGVIYKSGIDVNNSQFNFYFKLDYTKITFYQFSSNSNIQIKIGDNIVTTSHIFNTAQNSSTETLPTPQTLVDCWCSFNSPTLNLDKDGTAHLTVLSYVYI